MVARQRRPLLNLSVLRFVLASQNGCEELRTISALLINRCLSGWPMSLMLSCLCYRLILRAVLRSTVLYSATICHSLPALPLRSLIFTSRMARSALWLPSANASEWSTGSTAPLIGTGAAPAGERQNEPLWHYTRKRYLQHCTESVQYFANSCCRIFPARTRPRHPSGRHASRFIFLQGRVFTTYT